MRTRDAILERASVVASVEGLEGLSVGSLAKDLEMSKSGLFAHFGSKQELQLATIAAARETFVADVVEPAREMPHGLAQLATLCSGYLDYSERRVFPAGCFFFGATTEFSGRHGVVRDEAVAQMGAWLELLERNVVAAVELGELDSNTEARALAFELTAFLTTANWLSVSLDRLRAYGQARAAIVSALEARGAASSQLSVVRGRRRPTTRKR